MLNINIFKPIIHFFAFLMPKSGADDSAAEVQDIPDPEVIYMNITITREGKELTAKVSGRLDTLTSPEFEDRLAPELEGTEKLILDLGELSYLSSAGLRVMLGAAQIMAGREGMILRNVTPSVKEILDITGFAGACVIE